MARIDQSFTAVSLFSLSLSCRVLLHDNYTAEARRRTQSGKDERCDQIGDDARRRAGEVYVLDENFDNMRSTFSVQTLCTGSTRR